MNNNYQNSKTSRYKPLPLALIVISILVCGCAPLKVNQRVDSNPPSRFSRFSIQAKQLFRKQEAENDSSNTTDTKAADSEKQESTPNENVLTAEQAAAAELATRKFNDSNQEPHAGSPANQSMDTLTRERIAMDHLISVERQSAYDQAYEQGLNDAMQAVYQQATYQQPADRNYSAPPNDQANYPPDFQPNHPQQYQPKHLTHPQQTPDLNGPMSNQPFGSHGYNDLRRPDQRYINPAQPMNHAPQHVAPETTWPATSPFLSNQAQPPQHGNVQPHPTQTRMMPNPSPVSGRFSDSFYMMGSELRIQNGTATEIALELQEKNEDLLKRLKEKEFTIEQMADAEKSQNNVLKKTQALLTKSHRLAALLREKIAKQRVAMQDLEREKIAIEINADRALKDIEATLDGVLINSVTKSQPSSQPK